MLDREDIAWTIARMAFNRDMARVENNIAEYAGRLLAGDRMHINRAARDHAPSLLPIIRAQKIERAIARRRTQGE